METGRSEESSVLMAAMPGMVSTFSPALADLREQLSALDDAGKSLLRSEIEAYVAQDSSARKARGIAIYLAARLVDNNWQKTIYEVVVFCLLYVLDTLINDSYIAEGLPFKLTDPPRDYWYPRVDSSVTHTFRYKATTWSFPFLR